MTSIFLLSSTFSHELLATHSNTWLLVNPKEGNAFENLKHAGIARKIPLYHGNVLLEDFHLATEWLMAGQIGSLLYDAQRCSSRFPISVQMGGHLLQDLTSCTLQCREVFGAAKENGSLSTETTQPKVGPCKIYGFWPSLPHLTVQ